VFPQPTSKEMVVLAGKGSFFLISCGGGRKVLVFQESDQGEENQKSIVFVFGGGKKGG